MLLTKYPSETKTFLAELPSVAKHIVAEGDSWFDYLPGTDIIDCLRKHHNYSIRNYAKAGDTLVAAISPETHILVHGYGHTIPTGKGVGIFSFNFAGPWLRPALAMKGVFDPVAQKDAVDKMINSYNEMLSSVASTNSKFHHIDFRHLIDQHNDWANELHLRNSAYARASDAVHQKISSL